MEQRTDPVKAMYNATEGLQQNNGIYYDGLSGYHAPLSVDQIRREQQLRKDQISSGSGAPEYNVDQRTLGPSYQAHATNIGQNQAFHGPYNHYTTDAIHPQVQGGQYEIDSMRRSRQYEENASSTAQQQVQVQIHPGSMRDGDLYDKIHRFKPENPLAGLMEGEVPATTTFPYSNQLRQETQVNNYVGSQA